MKKILNINAGIALLLNEQSDALSAFDTISLNAGSVIASRNVYDKLISMGASINSGSMNIIDVSGDLCELPGNTVITKDMNFDGSYIFCTGRLFIEAANALAGISGMYANMVFHPESVDLSSVKGITATRKAYPDNAELYMDDITLGADSHIILKSALHWVYGDITALDGGALGKLREKNTTFQCKKLIIHTGLYEKFSDMFTAESYLFIPDDHVFTEDITLDAATSLLHGDKLYVYGDMLIPHDQAKHLSGFTSLIVDGTVTMPITAAKDFKSCGKANDYDLFEGMLMSVNGKETIGHEQLQAAIRMGLTYTLKVNGKMIFMEDVTPEDIEAVAAVYCNGVIYAPCSARGALDAKIKEMNGKIENLEAQSGDTEDPEDEAGRDDSHSTIINAGLYRL